MKTELKMIAKTPLICWANIDVCEAAEIFKTHFSDANALPSIEILRALQLATKNNRQRDICVVDNSNKNDTTTYAFNAFRGKTMHATVDAFTGGCCISEI